MHGELWRNGVGEDTADTLRARIDVPYWNLYVMLGSYAFAP